MWWKPCARYPSLSCAGPRGNFVSGYDWREGSASATSAPRWNRAWGNWEMNDVGTDEFIQALCRLINAEPYICVNAGEGTPVWRRSGWSIATEAQTRRWDGSAPRTGILNRIACATGAQATRCTATGSSGASGCRQVCAQSETSSPVHMREVDPSIQLIAVGVDADEWGQWNRKVLRISGRHHEYLSVHFYQGCPLPKDSPEAYETVVLGAKRVEWILRRTAEIIREEMPDNPPLIAFDEWNTWYPEANAENQVSPMAPLYDGIFAAGVFHALIRNAEYVGMANWHKLVNVLPALLVNPTQVVETPTWLAFAMYAPYFVGQRLKVRLPRSLEGQVDAVAVRVGERISYRAD